MDTSSPFAASRAALDLESVSLSQLLAHIRASDQTEAFAREVVYNSPARSVASTFVKRSSKRSGIIVTKRYSSDSDSDNETAITCSSIGSVSRRTVGGTAARKRSLGGTAARKRSLHSAWFDEEEERSDSDTDDGDTDGDTGYTDGDTGYTDGDTGYADGDTDDDVSTIAQRAASRAGLNPSKRSLENLKNMSMFDPGFSFSRTCVTSPVTERISPLENWFF